MAAMKPPQPSARGQAADVLRARLSYPPSIPIYRLLSEHQLMAGRRRPTLMLLMRYLKVPTRHPGWHTFAMSFSVSVRECTVGGGQV